MTTKPIEDILSDLAAEVPAEEWEALEKSKKPTCETCRYFNFKVSTDHAWGECFNPKVLESQHISVSLVYEIIKNTRRLEIMEGIDKYARILYREDTFGCRYHTPWTEEELKEMEEAVT